MTIEQESSLVFIMDTIITVWVRDSLPESGVVECSKVQLAGIGALQGVGKNVCAQESKVIYIYI